MQVVFRVDALFEPWQRFRRRLVGIVDVVVLKVELLAFFREVFACCSCFKARITGEFSVAFDFSELAPTARGGYLGDSSSFGWVHRESQENRKKLEKISKNQRC